MQQKGKGGGSQGSDYGGGTGTTGNGDTSGSVGGRDNYGRKNDSDVKKTENTCPYKNLYMSVHSNTIHNSQNAKVIPMSIDG